MHDHAVAIAIALLRVIAFSGRDLGTHASQASTGIVSRESVRSSAPSMVSSMLSPRR